MAGEKSSYQLHWVGKSVSITSGKGELNPASLTPTVDISGVAVDGALPLARAQVADMTGKFRNHRLTMAELFDLARSVEQAHRDAGYALARVLLPNQVLRPGGVLRIRIVDVSLEAIDVSSLPPAMAQRVKSLLEPLIGREALTSTSLAQAIGRAQFETGRTFTFAVADGSQQALAKLDVSGPANPLVTQIAATTFLSNYYRSILTSAATTGFGLGSDIRYSVGGFWGWEWDSPPAHGPTWGLSASGLIPLDGGSLGYLEPFVDGAAEQFDVPGVSRSAYSLVHGGARLVVPSFIDETQSMVFKLGPEIKSEEESYRYSSAGGSASASQPFDSAFVRGSLDWAKAVNAGAKLDIEVQALAGGVRTTDPSNVDSTRGIAVVRANVNFVWPLPWDATFSSKIAGQAADGPLPPSEQKPLLPIDSYLPLDPRAILGDTGASVRGEVARKFAVTFDDRPLTIEPYVFATAGALRQPETIFTIEDHIRGFAAGGGLRFVAPPPKGDTPTFEADVEAYRQQTTDVFLRDYNAVTISLRTIF